jgi:hypothetical protein
MQRRVLVAAGAVLVLGLGALALQSGVKQQVSPVTVDQGVATTLPYLPPGTTVEHGAADVNPLTGTLTLHALVLKRDGKIYLTADTMSLAGVDRQALQDVFDPAAYPGGHPAWSGSRRLIGDLSITGLHVADAASAQVNAQIGSITLHNFSGRPFALPPTPENTKLPQFQADAALALGVQSLALRDVRVISLAPKATELKLGALTITGYAGGKLDAVTLKTGEVTTTAKPGDLPPRLVFDDGSLTDVDATAALHSAALGEPAANGAMNETTAKSVADLHGLVLTTGQGLRISLHDAHAAKLPPGPGGARAAAVWFHGMTISPGDAPIPPGATAALTAFGMKALTLDIDATGGLKGSGPTQQYVATEDIVLHDLGTLHLKGSFSGLDAVTGKQGPAAAAAIMAMTLDQAQIIWDDGSLVRRLFAVAAVQMHTTPDLVRAQLAMPILTLGLMMPDQPDVADQVTAFLNNPHTLTVTMTPPAPVTFAQIAQAPATSRAHLLGVHILAQ